MKKAKLLSVVALLALSACEVPTLQQRKVLDSMVGKSEVDVIRQFGVPTKDYQAEGHSFLAYIDNQTQYSGGGGWGGGFPATYYNTSCQTTFELVSGHVVGWTMRGDGC
ncbi:hypothetical protein JK222_06000 [Gluconobacter cerinus]|uniref:hypothetical protein n=1 Tax=Gluconobacter cerinus TaxID=38307 RepID=UPI001B8CBDAB|nr:hypothetical protein [Gluconobacter cerinus]MBS1024484.1 hypothetical protein [Gluconobacter cerinus]MBS1071253.1 hypothetical protein [Gluconobacter cerinus]